MHRQMPYIIITITKQQQSLTQTVITLRYNIFSNKLVLYLIRPQNIYSLEIDGGGGGQSFCQDKNWFPSPFYAATENITFLFESHLEPWY